MSKFKDKVVVRLLPPTLAEEVFVESIKPYQKDILSISFKPGKHSLSPAKPSKFSRAYLTFSSVDGLVNFANSYDGHIFLDSRGIEFKAQVEFAPFQRVQKDNLAIDHYNASIEQDEEFKEFLQSLQESMESNLSIDQVFEKFSLKNSSAVEDKKTPLIDFLMMQRAERGSFNKGREKGDFKKKKSKKKKPKKPLEPIIVEEKNAVDNVKKSGDKDYVKKVEHKASVKLGGKDYVKLGDKDYVKLGDKDYVKLGEKDNLKKLGKQDTLMKTVESTLKKSAKEFIPNRPPREENTTEAMKKPSEDKKKKSPEFSVQAAEFRPKKKSNPIPELVDQKKTKNLTPQAKEFIPNNK